MKKRRNKAHKSYPTSLSTLVDKELGFFATPTSPTPLPLSIRKAWDSAVGARVVEKARPIKLVGKTLHVRVTSSSWMMELQMLTPSILEKFRKYSGISSVTDIRYELGTLPRVSAEIKEIPPKPREELHEIPPAIATALDKIADPELRDRIEKTVKKTYHGR